MTPEDSEGIGSWASLSSKDPDLGSPTVYRVLEPYIQELPRVFQTGEAVRSARQGYSHEQVHATLEEQPGYELVEEDMNLWLRYKSVEE